MITQLTILAEKLKAGAPRAPGIPFGLRVGVTGHRTLQDPASVTRRVEEVLRRIESVLPCSPGTPVAYTVFSAFAEGADRLVAKVMRDNRGADLRAILPLERTEFMKDFQSEESRAEFIDLLRRSVQPPIEPDRPAQRPEAYDRGGRALVDRVDVLIAVWDHAPARGVGGTAAVVEYAREKSVPTFVVSAVDSDRIDFLKTSRLHALRESFRQLDIYNRERMGPQRLEAAREGERGSAVRAARQAGIDESFADWVLPYFVRADILAGFYQWIYTRLALLVFLFAAFAVSIAAFIETYFPKRHLLLLIEVGLMVLVVSFVVIARRTHAHDRWISYRSLTENLRSAPFMAMLGASEIGGELGSDPFVPWFQRAFSEIWKRRPKALSLPEDPRLSGDFLEAAWIGGQITYHAKTSDQFNRRHRWLTRLIYALFIATFLCALLDALDLIDARILVFLAISLPAFGAALGGYRELRQYGLQSERYRRAGDRLEDIRVQLRSDRAAGEVKSHAARAYTVMLDENLEWFGVLEFADLEIVI